MSADNYIGVTKSPEGEGWIVTHGFMSRLDYEDDYVGSKVDGPFKTKKEAILAAHKRYSQEYIVEYGVIELD